MNISEAVATTLSGHEQKLKKRQDIMKDIRKQYDDKAKKDSTISPIHLQHGLQKDRYGKSVASHPNIKVRPGETNKEWVNRQTKSAAKSGAITGGVAGGLGAGAMIPANMDINNLSPAAAATIAGGATALSAGGAALGNALKFRRMGQALVKGGKVKGGK